ncbi:MAG: TetR/AcrR family transcriptional regulator [Alphaproteobacteria bacterium]
MPRTREFDIDDAIGKATKVFWAKGYAASSLNDLTDAMGLSRSSFYETFGSKHDLFLAALSQYRTEVKGQLIRRLDDAPSARDGLCRILDEAVDSIATEQVRRGCFLCNAAAEIGNRDAEGAARVQSGLKTIEDAFYRAITRGQESGEIPAQKDARALARALTSILSGLRVIGKAWPDRAMLEDVARMAKSLLA